MCRSRIAWEKPHTNLGSQLKLQYISKNIKTTYNILQSDENLK